MHAPKFGLLTPQCPSCYLAQVLVDLANLQDSEVGDGTTSVVILAAELLKNAGDLVKQKVCRSYTAISAEDLICYMYALQLHPTSIISGYRLAMREATRYIQESMSISVDELGREPLVNAAKTRYVPVPVS